MEHFPGAVLWEVHPASAQNKSLVSDTEVVNSLILKMQGIAILAKISFRQEIVAFS